MTRKLLLCTALLVATFCVPAVHAQQPEPIKRTTLQTGNFPGSNMNTLLVLVEVVPNAVVPRHTHPGGEVGYILEGSIEFTIGDQPPKTYNKGDTYIIPVSAPHVGKTGPAGAKLIGTFVVEKDKPLASPAP
jgi:quercetin dioxygenase-like cupin family protein